MVIAKGLLASILFFELPKSIKKILINPLLLHEGSNDAIRLKFAFEYGDVRLMSWLERKTEDFLQSDDTKQLENTYCIVRDFIDNFSQYDKWVSCYNQASTEDGTKNIFLTNTKDLEGTELLGHYHRIINKARKYFDPEFELVNINEVL